MKYKCIIFDCDGVLVDSELITFKVLIEMAKTVGLDIDMQFAEDQFWGKSLQACFKIIEDRIEGVLPEDYERKYRQKTFEAFKKDIEPIEGIHDLLNKIEVPFCVASSGPQEKIILNLETTKLIDQFSSKIFSCYDIQKWKPEPDIFLHAAASMGFKPEDCVVIEDSLPGVQAAIAGGFDVLAYVPNPNRNVFETMDVQVFYKMDALYDLL